MCAINHLLHYVSSRDSEEQTLNDFQIFCFEPKGKFICSSPIFSAKSGVFLQRNEKNCIYIRNSHKPPQFYSCLVLLVNISAFKEKQIYR